MSEASSQRIALTIEDGVAEVRLNRPDKMNALDPAMFAALVETGQRLAREPDLRAVVLSGEGKAFCAGLDMQSMSGLAGKAPGEGGSMGRLAPPMASATRRSMPAWSGASCRCRCWRPCTAWPSAAAAGRARRRPALCHRRCAAVGDGDQVGPAPDMAGMLLTRGPVREDLLRELIYTGRIVSGTEACELGLATRVVDDPRAAALAAAREIAGRSPDAIRAAKRLMQVAAGGDAAAILQAESVEQEALIGGANQREAVLANVEKRAPRFVPAAG